MTKRSLLKCMGMVCVLTFLGVRLPLYSANGSSEKSPGPAVTNLPLQPTRTIHFGTSEGTWTSLDVSPDGKIILFDLLGDLYTVPINGGKAQRIDIHESPSLAVKSQPRFSPDGQQIAFISDADGWENIWIANRDGGHPRQITHDRWINPRMPQSPTWTPNGEAIIASEKISGESSGTRLIECVIESGECHPLTHQNSSDNHSAFLGATFGSDPNVLYSAVQSSSGTNSWRIVAFDRRTHELGAVTPMSSGLAAMRPIASRDGRYLVYSAPTGDGTGLRIVDFRRNEVWWLIRHAQQPIVGFPDRGDLVPGSSFTPDGQSLVTSIDGKFWRIDVPSGRRAPIPFEVDVEKPLGPLARTEFAIDDGPFLVHGIRNPEVSPDGKRIAFSALDRIWIMDLPNGTPRRLTSDTLGEFWPTWSPDGKSVAYCTWSDVAGGGVRRISADGSGQVLLQTGEFYQKLAYTPDGTHLLAVRGAAALPELAAVQTSDPPPQVFGMHLVLLPISGGKAVALSDYPVVDHAFTGWKNQGFVDGRPTFRVSGNGFSFHSERGEMVSATAEPGSQREVMFRVLSRGMGREPGDGALAPNGRAVLITEGQSDRDECTLGLPYLIQLPENFAPGVGISLADGAPLPAGVRVHRLSETGAEFIGWTRNGVPYYGAGNSLFLADGPVHDGRSLPQFRHIVIRLNAKRDRVGGALLLRGARLLTMEKQTVIESGDLLIRDGRIAAIGPTGSVTAPANIPILDLRGKTILPGYIDVHDHIGPNISYGVHLEREPRLEVEFAFGVTTLRDPIGYGSDLIALRERERTGELLAPRVFTMGFVVSPEYFQDGSQQTLEQTQEVLKLFSEDYDSETIKQYEAGGRRTREFILMAANEQHLIVTNEGRPDFAGNLTFLLDGMPAFEHYYQGVPQYQDLVQLAVRSGTIQTPTLAMSTMYRPFMKQIDGWNNPRLQTFYPSTGIKDIKSSSYFGFLAVPDDEASMRVVATQVGKVMAAGGCVAMGGHGNIPGLGPHLEIWSLALGMSSYNALRAATYCSARAIGHEKDLGTLAPGKLADLQILDKNPLDDIKNSLTISYVMKNGRLYDANTLDEVWPQQRTRPRAWWQTDSTIQPK